MIFHATTAESNCTKTKAWCLHRCKPRNCIPWLIAEATKLSWVIAWAFFILLEREEAINDQRSYRRLILDTAYPILYFPFSSELIKRILVLMDQMGIIVDRVIWSYSGILSKWECFIKMRAAFLAPILPQVMKEGSSHFDEILSATKISALEVAKSRLARKVAWRDAQVNSKDQSKV